jgi:ATP-dependent helicase HrpB
LPKRIPDITLPLSPCLPDIVTALEEKGVLVLRADPGSGKSTLVPLALLAAQDEAGDQGKILVLEPRRAAALGIASRMAELLGGASSLGGEVGYAVRLERKVSARTRIEVITEGLLVRRLQNDPALRGVSTVIFDEFHERSIHTDLSLALVMDIRRMGGKIRVLVMSATMDALTVARYIDAVEARSGPDATPLIEGAGRVFPVDIRYAPPPHRDGSPRYLGANAAQAVRGLLEEISGDILVFLPGRREIADVASALRAGGLRDVDILSLHGGLPLERQREILTPPKNGKRRIVLSTNVAETGLTIPGIRAVVDSGFARIGRYHLASGMNRLSLEAISRQSADQRAGRAGRLGPGIGVRLWAEGDIRPEQTDPEIRRADLSALVLECLLWGIRDREGLPWIEPPSLAAWEQGLRLLGELGAIDPDGGPGRKGREMAGLGLEPRLASLCIAGRDRGLTGMGCAAAAILSDRDCPGLEGEADFRERLSLLRNKAAVIEGGGRQDEGRVQWINRTARIAGDLLKRLGSSGREAALSWTPEEEADAGELLGAAFPDRIARLRDAGVYRFASGREGRLEGPLSTAEWIVAAEADAGERMGRIRIAAPLSEAGALEILKSSVTVESRVEWKGLVPRSVVVKRAGAISISEDRRRSGPEEILPALVALLGEKGIAVLPWDGEGGSTTSRELCGTFGSTTSRELCGTFGSTTSRELLERIRFFANHNGPGNNSPDWSDGTLAAEAAEWLGPFVRAENNGGPVIDGKGLAAALTARLGWEGKAGLDRLVPDQFIPPRHSGKAGGRPVPIDYSSGEPVVRLRLQDAFGIREIREVLGVPVVFHLLSPAGRPVQVTRDLEGFWKGSYAEVRKEMRGRYPKHDWPEF